MIPVKFKTKKPLTWVQLLFSIIPTYEILLKLHEEVVNQKNPRKTQIDTHSKNCNDHPELPWHILVPYHKE